MQPRSTETGVSQPLIAILKNRHNLVARRRLIKSSHVVWEPGARMKSTVQVVAGLACIAAFAAALAFTWPEARDATAILMAQDDSIALSDAQMASAIRRDPALLDREIAAALQTGDADLAQSLVTLADARGSALSDGTRIRVADAVAEAQSAAFLAKRFATGLVTGETDDLASLSGTVAGDLFVFGDIRDMVREGKHLAFGEETDHLVLGLAAVGLAVTAGTYSTFGAAGPARAGLSIFKGARKASRISVGLTEWAGRSARNLVDGDLLKQAVSGASVLRPAQSARAIKAAVRTEKAGALVSAFKDVGRVGEKAGARAAMDVIKVADNPKDLAKAAKLAEAKGGQTRAILKILGRGALMLAAGAFSLATWLFSALVFLLGLVMSIKATTERLTFAYLRRAKARRLQRALAQTNAASSLAAA